MANFNTLIKRKQYLWLGLILVGGAGLWPVGCIFLT
jgi:conjugal transfer pilus assembly protein TraB